MRFLAVPRFRLFLRVLSYKDPLPPLFAAKSTLGMMYFWPPCGRARWGVVQPVGHLTVNEDGEGSNPSAPANFSSQHFAN